jgi:hypothetical protein
LRSTPYQWLAKEGLHSTLEEVSEWFFRQTQRVALLVFYTDDFVHISEQSSLRALIASEYVNQRSSFAQNIGKGLFETPPATLHPWYNFVQLAEALKAPATPE